MKQLIRDLSSGSCFFRNECDVPLWCDSKFRINFIPIEPALLHGVFVDSALPPSRDSEWNESHAVINHSVSCIAKNRRAKKPWCNIKNGLFCAQIYIYIYMLTLKLFACPLFIFGSSVFALSGRRDVAAHRKTTIYYRQSLPTARVLCFICVQNRASAKCVSISWSDGRHGGILRAAACFFLELWLSALTYNNFQNITIHVKHGPSQKKTRDFLTFLYILISKQGSKRVVSTQAKHAWVFFKTCRNEPAECSEYNFFQNIEGKCKIKNSYKTWLMFFSFQTSNWFLK